MRIGVALVTLGSLLATGCNGGGNKGGGSAAVSTGEAASCDPLPSTVVASADGIEITGTEVEQATAGQIYSMRQQIYETRRQWASNELAKRLLEREAKKEGMTLDEFMAKKVEGSARPVTEADARMFYTANQQMMPKDQKGQTVSFDEIKAKIQEHLTEQGRQQARSTYVQNLMASANWKVELEAPEPPIIANVSADDDPFKGPKDAPVTIVEFSDFQCPACRQAAFRLNDVLAKYEGKVKFVYRDFPLNRHVDALPAAVAANCAQEQGKYWEYHDLLWQNQQALKDADLLRYADQVKLDRAKFETCLKDPKQQEEVRKDLEAGEQYGVNSTPTFFVNGRIVSGANMPEISRLIEKELKKGSS